MNRGTLPEEFYEDIDGKALAELYRRYQNIRFRRWQKDKKAFITKKAAGH